jgi:hypothetical protein
MVEVIVIAILETMVDAAEGMEVEEAYVVVGTGADDVVCSVDGEYGGLFVTLEVGCDCFALPGLVVDDRVALLFRDVLSDGSCEATRVLELAPAWMVFDADFRLADVVLAR